MVEAILALLLVVLVVGAWKLISRITTVVSPSASPSQTAHVGITVDIRASTRARPSFSSATKPNECWKSAGEIISLSGRSIQGGLVYVGHGLPAVAGHTVEPALIDPTLSVGRRPDVTGAAMGYWPSYSDISPECRAAYLDWLRGGRRDPSAYIGYVFLYFYGLERRILSDAPPISADAHAESASIQREIEELLAVYGGNNSFRRYGGQLLDVLKAMNPEGAPPPLDRESLGQPLLVRAAMGRFVADGRPIPPEWALSWYMTHPSTSMRAALSRCPNEIQELFRTRYAKTFGEGIVVKAARPMLTLDIRPASASFGGGFRLSLGVPDFEGLSSQTAKLRHLGDECVNDLDAYSRWTGRNPGARKTVAALALLPAELAQSADDTEAKGLWNWLQTMLGLDDRALASSDDLLRHCPSFGTGKLAKSEGVLLAQLLEKQGYGIEPDVRFGGSAIAPGTHVVVFRLSKGAPTVASPQYASATILLHLAVAVANADGSISDSEEVTLAQHLRGRLGLTDGEVLRLMSHMAWLKNAQLGLAGLRKRLEALTPANRTSVADFLVCVAGADGYVSAEEVRILTKIFPLLGLASEDAYQRIHAMTAGVAPVGSEPHSRGLSATDARTAEAKTPTGTLRLNMAAVEAKLAESAKLASILGSVFNEEEPETPATAQISSVEAIPGKLSPPYSALLRRLAEQPQWTRDEFDRLAQTLGLMPDGSIDALNEMGFEHAGGPLLEGEDPIELDITRVKELLA